MSTLQERAQQALRAEEDAYALEQQQEDAADAQRCLPKFKEALKAVLGIDAEPDGMSYTVDGLTFWYRIPQVNIIGSYRGRWQYGTEFNNRPSLFVSDTCCSCGETIYYSFSITSLAVLAKYLNNEKPRECSSCSQKRYSAEVAAGMTTDSALLESLRQYIIVNAPSE
jgi:hypothetical protein